MVRPIEPSTTSYKFEVNTPLCRYGTGFIERLLDLRPERAKMDKVLEHFTVLHVSLHHFASFLEWDIDIFDGIILDAS